MTKYRLSVAQKAGFRKMLGQYRLAPMQGHAFSALRVDMALLWRHPYFVDYIPLRFIRSTKQGTPSPIAIPQRGPSLKDLLRIKKEARRPLSRIYDHTKGRRRGNRRRPCFDLAEACRLQPLAFPSQDQDQPPVFGKRWRCDLAPRRAH